MNINIFSWFYGSSSIFPWISLVYDQFSLHLAILWEEKGFYDRFLHFDAKFRFFLTSNHQKTNLFSFKWLSRAVDSLHSHWSEHWTVEPFQSSTFQISSIFPLYLMLNKWLKLPRGEHTIHITHLVWSNSHTQNYQMPKKKHETQSNDVHRCVAINQK